MTPKQKYDERKRLKIERMLQEEQRQKNARDKETEMEQRFILLLDSFERIADVLELWADMQENRKDENENKEKS